MLLVGVVKLESRAGERLSNDSLSASLALRACWYSCTKDSNLRSDDTIGSVNTHTHTLVVFYMRLDDLTCVNIPITDITLAPADNQFEWLKQYIINQ